jgi:hypothetical protein
MNQWTQGYCLTKKKPEVENLMRMSLQKVILNLLGGKALSLLFEYCTESVREQGRLKNTATFSGGDIYT